jgi:hypothetical protein
MLIASSGRLSLVMARLLCDVHVRVAAIIGGSASNTPNKTEASATRSLRTFTARNVSSARVLSDYNILLARE